MSTDFGLRSPARRLTALLCGLPVAAVMMLALPGDARACGGLFCNGGPTPQNPFAPLPVAQNGENVVFAITPDPAGGAPTLEAHIQILYTGDAAKFSWVVPVDAEPTLGTGTDRLFTALAGVTTPQFNVSYETSGTCIAEPQTMNAPTRGTTGNASGGTFGAAGSTGAAGPGVQVSFQGAVGPFDAAVIKSDDPTALKTWLTDNGYTISDAAAALIDTYVHENKFFVALKLLNGVGVNQIQPITLKFRGAEACVPLRLTAIAANPDMPVLVWVLGDKRVAPRGFLELEIDEARINWSSGGGNYFGPKGLVSVAANEAGGNAFITEYAGPSTVARAQVFTNGQINLDTLAQAMTPPAYVQALISMSLAGDPLVIGLLAKYIPMPDAVKKMGVTDVQFYGNIAMYWSQFAFPPFDLPGLTAAISTSIVTPRMNAQMMIDAHPTLTRLNTFISPEEMTKDPFFFEAKDLPNLSNVHTATLRTMCGSQQYMACNAPVRLELADGRMAWVRAGSTARTCDYKGYDFDGLQTLPALSVAWAREVTGDGQAMLDNRAKIATALDTYNAKFTTEMKQFPMGTDGGSPGLTGTGSGGCGCRVGARAGGGLAGGALLGLAAFGLLVARRRRRR
jgi:MYXO-CTERM domain-containing protein